MTTIYLAARYGRRDEIASYRDELVRMGYQSLSSWLDTSDAEEEAFLNAPRGEIANYAIDDLAAIRRARIVIAFSEEPNSPHGRGGRHIELGYALSQARYRRHLGQAEMRIIIVGPEENIFHTLPEVERYECWSDLKRQLEREAIDGS